MKKTLVLILSIVFVAGFTSACLGTGQTKSETMAINDSATNTNTNSIPKTKSLIILYSLTGNTKAVANQLQALTGADIMEIQTIKPYPNDFHAVVEQAREERRTGFLPPIVTSTVDLSNYETIYLGYPVWGNTIPQPMATFLSQNNLAGKTIIPFCTHDGYGIGRSFSAISEYCPDAKMLDGFDMIGADAYSAEVLLKNWLEKIQISLADNSPNNQTNQNETPITITIGNTVLSGTLNDSPTAREFISTLPQTITMGEFGGREYYGNITKRINTPEEGKLHFDDGDITYCPQNNTVAIFFAQTDRPNLTMKVISMGKITSDLSVFKNMEHSIQVTFGLAK